MNEVELAWAVGLFEGEGCITRRVIRSKYISCDLVLHMTDEDVVRRFYQLVGIGSIRKDLGPVHRGNKLSWRWTVRSRQEVAVLLKAFLPFLGLRRAAKATEAIVELEILGPPGPAKKGPRK